MVVIIDKHFQVATSGKVGTSRILALTIITSDKMGLPDSITIDLRGIDPGAHDNKPTHLKPVEPEGLEHQETRLRILHNLYNKHYGGQPGHPQQTDKVIEDAGLSNIDKNEAYAEVVYLKDRGLINGQSIVGYAYPPYVTITITSYGIDIVQRGVDNFIENINMENVEDTVKNEINNISEKEDRISRVRKVFAFLENHQVALLALAKFVFGSSS